MNKYLYTALACILAFAVSAAGSGGILRLHVVAHSDSAYDQAVKLSVRDAVLAYQRQAGPALSAAGAEGLLLADGAGLQAAVEGALAASGAEYGAELRIGDYSFPERRYLGATYPAGEYRALKVVLGDGAGQNWWCVLFPPLCIVEAPDGEIDEEAPFRSLILEMIREGNSNERPA